MFLSVVLHGAFAGLFAVIMIASQPLGDKLMIAAAFSVEETQPDSIDFATTELQAELPAESTDPMPTISALASTAQTELPEMNVADAAFPAIDMAELSPTGGDRTGRRPRGLGGGRKGSAAGPGKDGSGGTGMTSFFGKEVQANSVAFVIDASSSMYGRRFSRARKELEKALSTLKPDQRFFVVFYTDQTFPQFYPDNVVALINADSNAIDSVVRWIKRSGTQGGTRPQEAMAITLGLKPDVVFFLSDGQIPIETPEIIRQVNRGSKIHTITFGSDVGGTVMQQIAVNNGGTYQFVPD